MATLPNELTYFVCRSCGHIHRLVDACVVTYERN